MGGAARGRDFGRPGARLAWPFHRVLAPTTSRKLDKSSNSAQMAQPQVRYVCAGNFLMLRRVFGVKHHSRMPFRRYLPMTSTSVFEAAALRRRLSGVPLLSALDESSLGALETELEWLSLPGGCTLFREEEVADALYVVIAGCLGVTVRSGDGHDVLVAHARAGETIGEMALLGGETRSATVIAIRDTEVLRLGRVSYERLVEQHPKSMLSLLSLLVQRLRNTTHRADPAEAIRTLALVPMGSDERHIQFARDLADELATGGRRVRLLDSKVADNTTEWFNAVINDYALPFLALTRGRKVTRRLQEHFGNIRIDDLWRPYFCVSTNLTLGTLAVHRDGPLVQALRASVAIPGLLPPVVMEGAAHVDGGMMNCLPVDVMSSMRRGRIIAVDVASDPALGSLGEGNYPPSVWHFLRHGRKIPPIVDLLVRAGTVSSDALARRAREQADILFKPPLETVDLLDWHACDYAIGVGYRHATGQLEHADKSGLSAPW